MKNIKEWQKEFIKASNNFPTNEKWKEQDRLLSILRQLADVGGGIQKEQGVYNHPNKAYDDPNHRIAALIADILILAGKRNFDLDGELQKVLDWYQDKNKSFTK
ncbi:MAG: hypothetical protein WCT29_00010 [Candidatus Paceibacterota bacterium]|jgi:hypothetical protein